MGISLEQSEILTQTSLISYLELRLMNISAEKNLKHMQGSSQIADIASKMSVELNNVKKQLSDTPTSEEYQQVMQQSESIENDYQMQMDTIRDQMEAAEEKLNTQQETAETKLEVLRSERDKWKEARDKSTESFKYFQ